MDNNKSSSRIFSEKLKQKKRNDTEFYEIAVLRCVKPSITLAPIIVSSCIIFIYSSFKVHFKYETVSEVDKLPVCSEILALNILLDEN